jgi:hypothetical protein
MLMTSAEEMRVLRRDLNLMFVMECLTLVGPCLQYNGINLLDAFQCMTNFSSEFANDVWFFLTFSADGHDVTQLTDHQATLEPSCLVHLPEIAVFVKPLVIEFPSSDVKRICSRLTLRADVLVDRSHLSNRNDNHLVVTMCMHAVFALLNRSFHRTFNCIFFFQSTNSRLSTWIFSRRWYLWKRRHLDR